MSLVEGSRNPADCFLDILSVRHADLALERLPRSLCNLADQSHLTQRIILIAHEHGHPKHPRKLTNIERMPCSLILFVIPQCDYDLDIHIVELGHGIEGILKTHCIHNMENQIRRSIEY